MKRSKRIYILLGILVVACAITFGVSRYEAQKELIQNSDEVILEIPTDSVQSLSWSYEDQTLAFHKDGTWLYDEDDAFPVDEEKVNELLEQFTAFGASFIIQEVEDYSQYGLDDPVCTIQLTTDDETSYEIQLGDYSTMDSERYVSIGDGNVYLVSNDPLDYFDIELSDMIDNDDIPAMDQVTQLQFSGSEDLQVTYEEDGTGTYRDDDVYFTQQDGENLPLDTAQVDSYLQTIRYLGLTDYVTYNATEEDLQTYGLDNPDLTIQIDYTDEEDDGTQTTGTFVLSISRDPAEKAAAEAEDSSTDTAAESTGDTTETEEEEITAYARVGESKILYQLSSDDYTTLIEASYDAFRHKEVLPADFADVAQIDISLDGSDYTITTSGDADERTYYYGDEELDISTLQSALESLEADSFTDEQPTQQEEISLTVQLDLENNPVVQIDLYRYDGTYCLAVVDGQPVSLVERSLVVDLVEAVNAIVLN